ncbi:MAG: GDSL-type esterase/lipase family protein [Pseudomonadota bacterium]
MTLRSRLSLLAILVFCAAACNCASDPTDLTADADASTGQVERASGAVLWDGLPQSAHQYVNRRLDAIEAESPLQGGVIFVGDSITDGAPFYAMFPNLVSANHGIGWDTTQGVLLRIAQITRHAPERIFIMIGTNDTDYTNDHEQISSNIFQIVDDLNRALPETELYVVSILPRGGAGNAVITSANQALLAGAAQHRFTYLDLATPMRAENGELKPSLSHDNLHLNVNGYAVWSQVLGPCVWSGCPAGVPEVDLAP